jgi:hypothetical protein
MWGFKSREAIYFGYIFFLSYYLISKIASLPMALRFGQISCVDMVEINSPKGSWLYAITTWY